jgi:cytidylate kinase
VKRRRPVVAIDGPAGAGKTTVTRSVAEQLGYLLVDTGALYRSVALVAEERGVDWNDADRVALVAADLARREAIVFERAADGGQRVLLEGRDMTLAIRRQEVGQGASKVSAIPAVRAALLDLQRAAGARGAVVLEGRDIGTVVFPDAEAKFFLTASVEVRARRRFDELIASGAPADLDAVQRDVVERDRRDSERAVAPLRQAADAVLVDSSTLSIEEVVSKIVARVRSVEQRLASE